MYRRPARARPIDNRSLRSGRTLRQRDDKYVRIPGWSSGWNDEISAHAATRGLPRNLLVVMTAPQYDSAPRSIDDEVEVGLYRWDGEEWEQLGSADFDSVSDVLKLSDAELKNALTDDAEPEAREMRSPRRTRESKSVREQLVVTIHVAGDRPERREVTSLAQASSVARAVIDEEGLGASDMGPRHGEVHDRNGNLVARIAYNGRMFAPDGTPIRG